MFGSSWLRIRTNYSNQDPAKRFGSFRIRFHNTAAKSSRTYKKFQIRPGPNQTNCFQESTMNRNGYGCTFYLHSCNRISTDLKKFCIKGTVQRNRFFELTRYRFWNSPGASHAMQCFFDFAFVFAEIFVFENRLPVVNDYGESTY